MSVLSIAALGAASVATGVACIVMAKWERRAMDKQTLSVVEVAQLLTEAAEKVGPDAFAEIAENVLEDNSPGEIAAIGQYMSPMLRDLLPKRVLH